MNTRSVFFAVVMFCSYGNVWAAESFSQSPATIAWTVPCSTVAISTQTLITFKEKEKLQYSVVWGVMSAGKGTIQAIGKEMIDGLPAYHLSMDLQTTGLVKQLHRYQEVSHSWMDAAWLLPLRYTKQTRESHFERDEVNVYDPMCQRMSRYSNRLDKKIVEESQSPLPDPTFDIVSYIFYLRTLPLEVGKEFNLTLSIGDTLYPITVKAVRKEKVATFTGTFESYYIIPAVRKEMPKKLKQIEVWISTDKRKIPVQLRMELNFGSIMVYLNKIN